MTSDLWIAFVSWEALAQNFVVLDVTVRIVTATIFGTKIDAASVQSVALFVRWTIFVVLAYIPLSVS